VKLGAKPEGLPERIALALNLAPMPLFHTQIAFNAARSIMAAAALGVFEALGRGERSAEEVAAACRTHPRATRQLLNCLVGIGYARCFDGRYGMRRTHRKWLLRAGSNSIVDKLSFLSIEWDLMGRLEGFVRSGEALDIHRTMSKKQWALYQDAMRDLAAGVAVELAKRLPIPRGAARLLDIGGSHGLYSIELCRRHPELRSTVLELPAAMDRATAIAARHGMAERVRYRPGDALTEDLGESSYDVVMINNLVHHFTTAQNVELAKRVARALTPGGLYAVGEAIHDTPGGGGAVAATLDLYFALTSASGMYSLAEITSWQRESGLHPLNPIRFLSAPGWVVARAIRSA
jgi:2-polyprenyl-3-methyl-5-hydroxy-6-metoxy-1,4-benzoquinol methylase